MPWTKDARGDSAATHRCYAAVRPVSNTAMQERLEVAIFVRGRKTTADVNGTMLSGYMASEALPGESRSIVTSCESSYHRRMRAARPCPRGNELNTELGASIRQQEWLRSAMPSIRTAPGDSADRHSGSVSDLLRRPCNNADQTVQDELLTNCSMIFLREHVGPEFVLPAPLSESLRCATVRLRQFRHKSSRIVTRLQERIT